MATREAMMTLDSPQQFQQNREEPMTAVNKDTLIRNIVPLSESLILDSLMDELIARRILNFDERHQIYRNDATDREKVERFVMFFIKKPDSAYNELLECLRKTWQHHVVSILQDEDSLQ